LKIKTKKLKPNKYHKLKREALRGNVKGTPWSTKIIGIVQMKNIYAQIIDDTNSKLYLLAQL
jgi:ribosomal protein L18